MQKRLTGVLWVQVKTTAQLLNEAATTAAGAAEEWVVRIKDAQVPSSWSLRGAHHHRKN
jgi:hypothetical protein